MDDQGMDDMIVDDPYVLFERWFADATRSEPNDPNAMSVATVGPDGMPSVRILLLKGVDARGFVFYTNLESRKGRQITATGKVALCFHWKSLRRQVRVEGPVERVTDAEADAYFASRPRGSQIGAWASLQSQPLESRALLEARVAEMEARFPGTVPRPPHWSGTRVLPTRIEFWRDREFRLHDRIVYTPDGASPGGGSWRTERQFP